VARFRCLQERAFLLLGSATPDLGSRYLAERGEYGYCLLEHRYSGKPLPEVRIVDMKQELLEGNTSSLSRPLKEAILSRLERGEQTILFLNRRGTSKLVTCSCCGYIYRCPHCSVAMTWHARRNRMICHYCGSGRYLDSACPECGGKLSFFGPGTQKLEEELRETFPGTEVLRVDADSVSPVGSHRVLFRRFTEEKIPLMIGTQMIAKGLNFENVTLVGVVSADQGLYANDWRAGERTFSLLAQVIGRCGRGDKPGEALIQTFTPDSEIIRLAAAQDYEAFYRAELEMRRLQNAPPFFQWAALSASGEDEERVLTSLRTCRGMLQKLLDEQGEEAELLGPVPLSVVKVSDRYRFRIQIRCRMNRRIRQILSAVLIACAQDRTMRRVSFYIENEAEG
jgi:primosomal protein N' (replication factor Y)